MKDFNQGQCKYANNIVGYFSGADPKKLAEDIVFF